MLMRRRDGARGRASSRWALALSSLALAALSQASADAATLYVSNQGSNSVSVYGIGAGGLPSPVTCDPTTDRKTGTHPFGVAIDPSGTHLYTANSMAGSVSVFTIGAGGALSPVTCDPTTSCKATAAASVAVDPSGTHVYAVDVGNPHGSVDVFSIGAGGALTPVTCDPSTSCQAGNQPEGIAIDPGGKHVYVANSASNSVSVFSVGADGALTPVTCDPTTSCKTGNGATAVAVDPSGTHVYVTNGGSPSSVSVFSIGPDGALSPVTCDPSTSCAAASGPEGIAIHASGTRLYTSNEGANNVSAFSIGAGGALSPIACTPSTNCATGTDATALAVSSHVYVSSFVGHKLSVFAIGAGGELSPVTCDPTTICKTGTDPSSFSVAISPDRGPTAAFSESSQPAGSPSRFDASGSTSPDYPIASYAWNFGDGQTQTASTPTT